MYKIDRRGGGLGGFKNRSLGIYPKNIFFLFISNDYLHKIVGFNYVLLKFYASVNYTCQYV